MSILKRLYEGERLTKEEFLHLLENREQSRQEAADYAVKNHLKYYGKTVFFRALIEISSYCRRNCYYCGIRAGNKKALRYRMDEESILMQAEIAYAMGFRTVVMQGGEDPHMSDDMIASVVRQIKTKFDIAVTLSLGEKSEEAYKKFKDAGADRYLLRHETADPVHYQKLHPSNMHLKARLNCVKTLQNLGFQVGMGMMIGSPYQTLENIAQDLMLIQSFHPHMIGVGPFIHHDDTPFGSFPDGSPEMVYYVLSLIRLIHPQVLLPITTALGTLDRSALEKGLQVGGNVIMPNMSPDENKVKYSLYKNKADYKILQDDNLEKLKTRIAEAGYIADMQKGNYREAAMAKFDIVSTKAEEFINHEYILQCLEESNQDKGLSFYQEILEKARQEKGLSHMDVAYLIKCPYPEIWDEIYALAIQIKQHYYGSRIVLFAPLYLSNYCVNGCVYCPYHAKNKNIRRKKLTQEEIEQEVTALMDMGHKRLALEMGEHDTINSMEYLLESIKTIYSIKHKNGAIRRVNVNVAATTVENYRKFHEAGIGTYILFQETYHKENYEALHPSGPKSNYAWHTEAMDRAMEGGIDDVGCGVLFGLNNYDYDLLGLMLHAEHLEARFGVGPHTLSVPRICPADSVNPEDFENALSDELFKKIVALLRIAVPYTGIIISTRESKKSREEVLKLGVSQLSGGSKTSVGGYSVEEEPTDNTAQFDLSDNRTVDEIVEWLMEQGHMPSFCTACYREGRTGDRFMALCKSKQICNVCLPNALLTLNEYLEDYAKPSTFKLGKQMIAKELTLIKNEKVKRKAQGYLGGINEGKRDFRF